MNKKKIIISTSVIVIVVIALICIIANSKKKEEIVNINDRLEELGISTKVEEKTKLKLTDEMLDEISDKIKGADYEFPVFTIMKIKSKLGDKYNYSDYEITNKKQTDDYTYTVYIKFYYEDNYGNGYTDTMDAIFTAVEDTTTQKGYSIETDYRF